MKLLAFYVALLSLVLLLREYQQANEDREIRLLKQKHERLQKQSDSTKRVLAFLSTKPEFRKAASEVYIEILRAK